MGHDAQQRRRHSRSRARVRTWCGSVCAGYPGCKSRRKQFCCADFLASWRACGSLLCQTNDRDPTPHRADRPGPRRDPRCRTDDGAGDPVPDLPRHDDRQRRARQHPVRARRRRHPAAVGAQRLLAGVRQPDADRGHARRPVRAQMGDGCGHRRLLRRLGHVRPRAVGGLGHRRPRGHGHRRRRLGARHALGDPPALSGPRTAGAGPGCVVRGLRALARARPGDRGAAGQPLRLAGGVLVQPRLRRAAARAAHAVRAQQRRPAARPPRRRRLRPRWRRARQRHLCRHLRRAVRLRHLVDHRAVRAQRGDRHRLRAGRAPGGEPDARPEVPQGRRGEQCVVRRLHRVLRRVLDLLPDRALPRRPRRVLRRQAGGGLRPDGGRHRPGRRGRRASGSVSSGRVGR